MGASTDDDVMDPLGGSRDDYRRMLTEVSELTQTLRDLAWPSAMPPAARDGDSAKRIQTAAPRRPSPRREKIGLRKGGLLPRRPPLHLCFELLPSVVILVLVAALA